LNFNSTKEDNKVKMTNISVR